VNFCISTTGRPRPWRSSKLLRRGTPPKPRPKPVANSRRAEIEEGFKYLVAFHDIRELVAPFSAKEQVEILGEAALEIGVSLDEIARALRIERRPT
jgi:hypothetical protein